MMFTMRMNLKYTEEISVHYWLSVLHVNRGKTNKLSMKKGSKMQVTNFSLSTFWDVTVPRRCESNK